ncbi:MAG: 2-octaprenyl-6-methoxyphenol hydroxylase [Methylococcaceae bacterium NSP1-2]|nr:2-octaprenyl-6-methoxyphenyl hydroxylase [Methylococcaceae bacterium]OYV21475.1 MAG: 2-octaprenyl-6-methoxyphenol hydroxylase [Methylococcaceae bacterium NSP1-2]
MQDYDLIIVGGGLAGNCLALALKDTGLTCAIIEANTPEQLANSPAGDRALALAAGTVKQLEDLGVWQGISHAATAIKNIHISDRGHFGKTRLSAEKEHVDALGYVITARDLETHVAQRVTQTNTVQICPARVVGLASDADKICVSIQQGDESITLTAKLLIGADGGQSSIRKLLNIAQQITEYGQTALVTTVKSTLAHKNTAFERFTTSGPLALLPTANNQCAVVWTRSTDDAQALMQSSEADFLAELQQCFGYKLGKLSLTAPRRSFPLSLIRAEKMRANRAVIIGNAVHQLHPVAGQGFNLGLRDVMQLADRLISQHQAAKDIGADDFLTEYSVARQKDHDLVINFTNNVIRIFSNDWLPLAAARNVGLTLLDHIPKAKSLLSRYAMGLEQTD